MESRQRILPEFKLPKPMIKQRGLSQFRHSRHPSAPVGDVEIVENEHQSILCVNCLDSVSEEAIDLHIMLCTTYISLISYEGLYNLNNSLVKYKAYMQHLQRISQDAILKSLETAAEKLLSASSQSLVEEVCQDAQNIHAKYSGTIHKKLCIDRLLEFAKQKVQLIDVSQQRAQKLKNMKKHIQKVSSQKDVNRNRATDSYSIEKNIINDIQSQLNTHIESEKFSDSLNGSNRGSLVGNLSHLSTDGANKQEFYTKCLLAKHKFPSKHPVQSLPIHTLYQRAIEKNVEPDKWDLFISQELNNAEVSLKKPVKRFSERIMPRRFDSIDEEDEHK